MEWTPSSVDHFHQYIPMEFSNMVPMEVFSENFDWENLEWQSNLTNIAGHYGIPMDGAFSDIISEITSGTFDISNVGDMLYDQFGNDAVSFQVLIEDMMVT